MGIVMIIDRAYLLVVCKYCTAILDGANMEYNTVLR